MGYVERWEDEDDVVLLVRIGSGGDISGVGTNTSRLLLLRSENSLVLNALDDTSVMGGNGMLDGGMDDDIWTGDAVALYPVKPYDDDGGGDCDEEKS